jgi:hypothetical protein
LRPVRQESVNIMARQRRPAPLTRPDARNPRNRFIAAG